MKVEYYKEFSSVLKRSMEFKVYGHKGKPCICFPTECGRFYDYENRGIIESMRWYIENGKIQLFCLDSLDSLSWLSNELQADKRMENQEKYFNYVLEEIVPKVFEINGSDSSNGIMTFGIALGAMHALNFVIRRPDIFNQVLALSGIYHSGFYIKKYADELSFLNSPLDSLEKMKSDHPYVELYKKARIFICVGHGFYEDECIKDTKALEVEFKRLGIKAYIDYWGYDKPHDWPSWLEQVPYFLYKILD